MEKLAIGITCLVLGFFMNTIKEWLFERKKRKKEADYLAIQIVCMLERFVAGCEEVVQDNGLCCGQYNSDGCAQIQTKEPRFEPQSIDVDWKSLPSNIMYEILFFPSLIEAANCKIRGAFEYAASPPDYNEGFEERQYQYAILGIQASAIASSLYEYGDIPKKEIFEWNPLQSLKEAKDKFETLSRKRAETHKKSFANMPNQEIACDE